MPDCPDESDSKPTAEWGKAALERVKEVPTPPELLLDWPSQHKDPDERDDDG